MNGTTEFDSNPPLNTYSIGVAQDELEGEAAAAATLLDDCDEDTEASTGDTAAIELTGVLEIAEEDNTWLGGAVLLICATLEELEAREELKEMELEPAALTLEELT